MSQIEIKLFKSPELNDVANHLYELDNQYISFIKRAENHLYSAFETRWRYGQYISENYDLIIKECGTQKEFANAIGHSEGVVSNNKRAYEHLKKEGCETFAQVRKLLEERQIRPTIRNFEKIQAVLNEPDKDTTQIEQVPKDRRRLEEIMEELQDIIKRNESGTTVDIAEDATELLDDIDDISHYIEGFDVFNSQINSERYLNYIRNYGFDVITKEPCERCDPHHIALGSGKRQNDLMTLPVSRKTHMLLHTGLIELSKEEQKELLLQVMGTFIRHIL